MNILSKDIKSMQFLCTIQLFLKWVLIMLSKVKITNLFGRFDYNIDFKDKDVTIITGPNGFGKSTILKIIDAVSKGNIFYISTLMFEKIELNFDQNVSICFQKNDEKFFVDNLLINSDIINYEPIQIRRRFPWIRYKDKGVFVDLRNNTVIEEKYLQTYCALSYGFNDENNLRDLLKNQELIDKINSIKLLTGNVRLISEQRLFRKEFSFEEREKVVDTITELPDKLKTEISKVSEEYASKASRLDSTYPKRLFAATIGLQGQEEYRKCLDVANKKFEKLNQYKLVDMSIIDEPYYKKEHSTALKIYFDDFSEKHEVFEKLIKKLDAFTKIINDRFSFKRICISRQEGFYIEDIDNGKRIGLDQLSSGEKQEIVLFYDLIFGIKEGLLLLIDEPEISLHIAWQKKFLDDLLDVADVGDVKVIVATHSPQIISNHWDIQVDLGDLYAGQLNKG